MKPKAILPILVKGLKSSQLNVAKHTLTMNQDVLRVTKDNLDEAVDQEDVPDLYEALNDDVLVVGENDVARVISMQNIFHDGSTSSHQLLNSTEEIQVNG